MLQENEVRIGNAVKDSTGRIGTIMSIGKSQVRVRFEFSTVKIDTNHDETGLDVEAVPLTPEILEKIGFKRIDHVHGYSFYSLSQSKKNRCHIDIYPEKTSWMSYSVKHCKYVHELQNLYYSLVGSELEIVW
jgi:hypothetical protein